MKLVLEEGDQIVEDGDLKPGVYVVDGKNPRVCGINTETMIQYPRQWNEKRTLVAIRFVLEANLLCVKER